MKGKLFVIALVFLAAGRYVAQGSILIDDFFTTPQGPLSRTCSGVPLICANEIGIPIWSTAFGGGILGGERDIRVDLISCQVCGPKIEFQLLSYDHSQGGGVKGTSMAVWDGVDGDGLVINPTGLGGVDLTQGGLQDALEVNIIFSEPNGKLVYEVFTDAGNSSKFTLSLPAGALNERRVIPYSSFSTNLGFGADFTNVGAISMLVDGSTVPSLDMLLDKLQTTSTLTATKVDSHLTDPDADGLVDVGEQIRYTVAIDNPDDDQNSASPNVHFGDDPPLGAALVDGSVTSTQGVVITGNTAGDTSVAVNIGDIADGVTVTVTFDVVVTTDGPPMICNQGFVTRTPPEQHSTSAVSLLLNLPTDDPDTVEPDDPTCTPISYCGDGILDPNDEQCDDGNNVDTDCCTNACQLPRCGDGIVTTTCPGSNDICDDGNSVDTDCCTNACQLPRCGDGIVTTTCPGSNDICDDGNSVDTDCCTSTCQPPRCGDGFVSTCPGSEDICDDGNTVDTDCCTNACQPPRCGDGIVTTTCPGSNDICDDGNPVDTDCCTNACQPPRCGDGFVSTCPGSEDICDDGNTVDTDCCTNACQLPRCGDGIVTTTCPGSNDLCDDGNTLDTDCCTNACQPPRCGDGVVTTTCPGSNDLCDDGNTMDTDCCTNACQLPRCGDGIVTTTCPGSNDLCDDGNTNNNDDCSNNCTSGCGNGIVNTGEECDGMDDTACPGVCQTDCTCPTPPQSGACCDADTFGGCQVLPESQCNCDKCVFHKEMPCEEVVCTHNAIPTVSQWGLVVLTLLLLTGAKIYFGRRQVEVA